jgi:hypothetical protein
VLINERTQRSKVATPHRFHHDLSADYLAAEISISAVRRIGPA